MTGTVLASGNLASAQRTITGVLEQLAMSGHSGQFVAAALRAAGLPGRASRDPEFPVSAATELALLSHLVRSIGDAPACVRFALERFSPVGINYYGMLGLTMQHAATLADAIAVMLDYPEMSWGHTRIALRRDDAGLEAELVFEMGAPLDDFSSREAECLTRYCIVRDIASIARMLCDVCPGLGGVLEMELPFPDPHRLAPVWPLTFDARQGALRFPATLLDRRTALANALLFSRYETIMRESARLLAAEVPLSERVIRLLWAYTPAPTRQETADMLAMTERTLARRLAAEGLSFRQLLHQVRKERAATYLRHTALPVAVIAERMGYADSAAFTRAFLTWYREPPSRWRARWRGTDATKAQSR